MHTIQSHLSRLFSRFYITSRPSPPFISRRLSFSGNMSGGSNLQRTQKHQNRNKTVGRGGWSNHVSNEFKGEQSSDGSRHWIPKNGVKDVMENPNPKSPVDSEAHYDQEYPPLGNCKGSSYKPKKRIEAELPSVRDHRTAEGPKTTSSPQLEASPAGNQTITKDETMLEPSPTSFGNNCSDSPTKRHKIGQTFLEDSVIKDSAKCLSSPEPSDICNSEMEGKSGNIPQPGMVMSNTTTSALEAEASPVGNQTIKDDEALLPTSFGKKGREIPTRRPNNRPTSSGEWGNTLPVEKLSSPEPFDICYPEKQQEARQVLRPGMVLLKNYISLYDQIQIVKKCQELGKGPGGFYQPGYDDGAKLRLQMMCLGQDWDPRSRTYGKHRAFDGSETPPIPSEFELLVKRAIQDSQALIEKDAPSDNVEDILPSISPDICIVNFYSTNGRLGLHQDRDESKQSLRKGLPVVSFSIGNAAEFLYSDRRDVDNADRVVLESGDVLIFGGKSRHIFHGVSHIIPKSSPRALWDVTNLKPGRLNLTFRQY